MGLLKAARGGVIDDLSVDWGVDNDADVPENTDDDDFEMISEISDTLCTAAKQSEAPQAPLNLFGNTADETKANLGPQKSILNLSPPPTVQQAPKSDKLPIPLYPGFRCSIFAIIKQAKNPSPHPPNIKVTGKVLGREVILQVPVNPVTLPTSGGVADAVEGGRILHTLAAKALIQIWEDLPTSLRTRRKSNGWANDILWLARLHHFWLSTKMRTKKSKHNLSPSRNSALQELRVYLVSILYIFVTLPIVDLFLFLYIFIISTLLRYLFCGYIYFHIFQSFPPSP
jgi:hypothetical protein